MQVSLINMYSGKFLRNVILCLFRIAQFYWENKYALISPSLLQESHILLLPWSKLNTHTQPRNLTSQEEGNAAADAAAAAAAAAKSLQSCPTLCDPIDGSPPGSSVPGILQARILEWVAISFSNAWKWKVKVKLLSRVRLLATPWTAVHQAPLSMGFSRQEYWSGVPLPSLPFDARLK